MQMLVTGAAGFIGSHLAERLVADGHTVIGIDGFTDYYARDAKERNLERLCSDARFTLIEADLLDLELSALLERSAVDYVFHLAAQPGVRGSWGRNFEIYTRNNIVATQRLLEAAKQARLKKFVYASSSSIYGDAEAFPTAEDIVPRPISPYGVTKLAAEQLVLLYGRNYGLPVIGTRYFTVYGPRQRPDMAFHRFIRSILQGDDIYVFGDGEQTRDFTFVGDAVEGTLRAAFSDAKGQVFNIGGGSRVTLSYIISLLEDLLNRPVHRRYLAPQHGDARDTAADIRRASELLGYHPGIPLEEGLSREAKWLQSMLAERVMA